MSRQENLTQSENALTAFSQLTRFMLLQRCSHSFKASDYKIKETQSKIAELKNMVTNLLLEAVSPPFIV